MIQWIQGAEINLWYHCNLAFTCFWMALWHGTIDQNYELWVEKEMSQQGTVLAFFTSSSWKTTLDFLFPVFLIEYWQHVGVHLGLCTSAGYIGDDFLQCPWASVSKLNAAKSWAPSSPGIVWTKQWWIIKFGGSNGPNKNHNYPQKKKLRDSVVPETSKHLYYFLSVFQNLKEAFSFEGVPEGRRNKYFLASPHIHFCLPHILALQAYNLNLSGLVAAMTYVWDAPYAGGERWRCSPKALLRTDVNPWHRQGDLLFG